jgi:hypothetical protein
LLDVIRPSETPFSANPLAPVAQVDGDSQLLELWLHGRSQHTQRAYRTGVDHFLACVRKPLPTVTVGDVQAWMDTLEYLAPASRARFRSTIWPIRQQREGVSSHFSKRSRHPTIRQTPDAGGVPSAKEPAGLTVLETMGTYSSRRVSFFRAFDPARTTARALRVSGAQLLYDNVVIAR